MKILRWRAGLLVAVTLFVALSVTDANSETPQRLTQGDCSLIFSRTDDCRSSRDVHGELYCKAWYRGQRFGDDPVEFFGYVFLKPFSYKGTDAELLIGIAQNGQVYRVKVKGVDSIEREFLSQFEGKRAGDSFAIAESLEDILYVPSRVKAMRGDIETSRMIASAVKDALSSAKQLASN